MSILAKLKNLEKEAFEIESLIVNKDRYDLCQAHSILMDQILNIKNSMLSEEELQDKIVNHKRFNKKMSEPVGEKIEHQVIEITL